METSKEKHLLMNEFIHLFITVFTVKFEQAVLKLSFFFFFFFKKRMWCDVVSPKLFEQFWSMTSLTSNNILKRAI